PRLSFAARREQYGILAVARAPPPAYASARVPRRGPMIEVASGLIGREDECRELAQALARAECGDGGLLLVAGEAGIGKTRLVDEAVAGTPLRRLAAAATEDAATPYEQIVAIFRSYLRQVPGGLSDCGP